MQQLYQNPCHRIVFILYFIFPIGRRASSDDLLLVDLELQCLSIPFRFFFLAQPFSSSVTFFYLWSFRILAFCCLWYWEWRLRMDAHIGRDIIHVGTKNTNTYERQQRADRNIRSSIVDRIMEEQENRRRRKHPTTTDNGSSSQQQHEWFHDEDPKNAIKLTHATPKNQPNSSKKQCKINV